jgi:hypothetical protein
MARVFITGSADGLGRLAAQTLLDNGHDVVVHTRTNKRLEAVQDLVDRGAEAVVGDLADLDQTREVAKQVNRLGRMVDRYERKKNLAMVVQVKPKLEDLRAPRRGGAASQSCERARNGRSPGGTRHIGVRRREGRAARRHGSRAGGR